MPQLPDAIFERRVNAEYDELRGAGVKFSCNSTRTEYEVELKARGLAKRGGQIVAADTHRVLLRLLRSYPYAGGLEVTWLTPIFHPNIRSSDGRVCIQLLNAWAESQGLVDLYNGLRQLVEHPNPEDPLDPEAADYYARNPQPLASGEVPQRRVPRIIP